MLTKNVQATALLSGTFLSGAMMSLCLVTVPALMEATTDAAMLLRQWTRIYHYGHAIMPAMAIGTFALCLYTALMSQRSAQQPWRLIALAGVTTLSIAPFTWVVMMPTNNALFAMHAESSGVELGKVQQLVVRWTWLHAARSLLPLAGSFMQIKALGFGFGGRSGLGSEKF